jgi:hypothetical protein
MRSLFFTCSSFEHFTFFLAEPFHFIGRFFHPRRDLITMPSRRPPSSTSATRAPRSRRASMASLEKTFALMSISLASLLSRGSITRRIGPRAPPLRLQDRRTRLISSCRILCRPRNRLRKVTSVAVRTIRKLKSHAKANPDTPAAIRKFLASFPCGALLQAINQGKPESPPMRIHAGRSAR